MTDTTAPKIDPQFLAERGGRTFILYAGLLDAAHRAGLKRITTKLLQVGDEANGQTWIACAEVETTLGTFTGIGDASPANVAPAMARCLPRMAETRAKARALRDAVNAGALVSVEELAGDEGDHGEHRPTSARDNGNAAAHSANGAQHRPMAVPTTRLAVVPPRR